MKIERILREPRGSVVTLGGQSYHFKPSEEGGPHIADVDNDSHAEVLLRITEAYRPYGDEARAMAAAVVPQPPSQEEITAAVAAAAQAEAQALATTDKHNAPSHPADLAQQAQTPAQQTEPVSEGTDDDKTDSETAKVESDLESLSDADLRKAFEAEVGRKPHPKMLAENMIAQIAAAREESQ